MTILVLEPGSISLFSSLICVICAFNVCVCLENSNKALSLRVLFLGLTKLSFIRINDYIVICSNQYLGLM